VPYAGKIYGNIPMKIFYKVQNLKKHHMRDICMLDMDVKNGANFYNLWWAFSIGEKEGKKLFFSVVFPWEKYFQNRQFFLNFCQTFC
jgi:hypothetical protein